MSIYKQQPLTGPVEYKKGIYTTLNNKHVNIHYFGDDHLKRTQCTDPHALSLLSLLVSSFEQPHPELDVFVEVGLGLKPKHETNYLNGLIKDQYGCLLNDSANREKCGNQFPNVRFHNIDFRFTLYFEYMQVINYIIKHVEGTVSNSDVMLETICQYATMLMSGSEHQQLRVPYPTTFNRDRELLRLSLIYDMVRARKALYEFHRFTSFSDTMEQFIIDLYYLIGISPSIKCSNALLSSPICDLFPHYLSKKPYYFYRLAHEYSTVPDVIKEIGVRERFDMVLREYLGKIQLSYKRIRSKFAWATSTYPYDRKIEGHSLVDFCVMNMASFMDMYVCFRALKPYVNNVIVVCGVYHISTINQLFADLGLNSKTSASFVTIDPIYDKGVQCISIPVIKDNPQLSFNDDVFDDMIYVRPSYRFRDRKHKKKKTKNNYKTRGNGCFSPKDNF